jgi:MFS family permease
MAGYVTPRRSRFLLRQWSELLEQDAFRRFWIMRLATTGASNALSYALLVFTVRLSGSALATGGLLLTLIVPSALTGAIGGVAVDRLPRGLILFAANALRAALMFALLGARDSLPLLYLLSLSLGVVAQFAVPAEMAVLPHIVRSDRITAANSFLSLGTLAAQAAGLLITAPLLLKTTDGSPLLFLLMGLFGLSAVLVTVIPQFHFTSPEHDGGPLTLAAVRREFAESWMTLCRDSTAYLGLVLSVSAATSILVVGTLLPKFSSQVLGVRPENIVFVLAPAILGIFLGIRCVDWLIGKFDSLKTISGAYLLMAVSLGALGFVPATGRFITGLNPLGAFDPGPLTGQSARIAATVIYANCYGFALTVVLTMGRVLLNQRIPIRMQGRVFAAQSVLANLVAIVPVVAAALIADAVGVAPVFVLAGIGALLAAVWTRAQASRVVPAAL